MIDKLKLMQHEYAIDKTVDKLNEVIDVLNTLTKECEHEFKDKGFVKVCLKCGAVSYE